MGQQKRPEQFAKFLSYILGRKPDEFGLVLDQDGFVKIKELLKALCEEEGWRHIRKSHIDEILITLPNPPVEIKDNLIRARERENLTRTSLAQKLPGLVYTCVRSRAYPVVIEKGIFPGGGYSRVILSSDRNMAERIGRRTDPSPVALTVHVQKAVDKGVKFYQAGDTLFLAESVPADCFTGPPLPKEKPELKKEKEPQAPLHQRFPGSFFIDLTQEKEMAKKKDKRIREKERTLARKQKHKKMWGE